MSSPQSLRFPAITASLGALVLLAGCTPPPPSGPATRQYAIDQTGAAKTCTASNVTLAPGQTTEVAVTMSNDRGWCGIHTALKNKPYDVGLLTARPAHGTVYVHTVGDDTRIDYTPKTGFTGTDAFSVTLQPGAPVMHVTVTVNK